MAPTLVLAGWIFIQVTLGLSTLVLLANQAGFLDGAAAWAASCPAANAVVYRCPGHAIGSGLGTEGMAGLNILNDAGLFIQNPGHPAALAGWRGSPLLGRADPGVA